MLLLGCDQAQDHATEQEKTEITEQASDQNIEQQAAEIAPNKAELKSGNIFIWSATLLIYSLKLVTMLNSLKIPSLMLNKPSKIRIRMN